MHLLATDTGDDRRRLGGRRSRQTPGDIVLLSSADTEIALLAAAQERRRTQIRLRRACGSRRSCGSATISRSTSTWRRSPARGSSLPGCSAAAATGPMASSASSRPAARTASRWRCCRATTSPTRSWRGSRPCRREACRRLWRYLAEGGPANAENFLRYAASLIGPRGAEWAEPAPLLRAGLYWPGRALPSLDEIAARMARRPAAIVPIVFYRALVQSGNTAPVDALVHALVGAAAAAAADLRAEPQGWRSRSAARRCLRRSAARRDPQRDRVFRRAPALATTRWRRRIVRCCRWSSPAVTRKSWRGGTRGLGPRDLAMNVALPEIDGRILSRAVSFKAPLGRDPETEADLVGYRPVADRVAFVADLARTGRGCGRSPPAERRIALVLANYPNRDGRIGNGVGLDTPARRSIDPAGARRGRLSDADAPDDAEELIGRLLAGPTNANPGAPAEETLSFAEYSAFFATLPPARSAGGHGALGRRRARPVLPPGPARLRPLRDPRLPCRQYRGADPAGARLPHRPEIDLSRSGAGAAARLSRLLCLARRRISAPTRSSISASTAISNGCPARRWRSRPNAFPKRRSAPLPHLYPFIVNDPGEGTQAKRRAEAVIVDHLTPPLTRADSYGALAELERLIDEYYEAALGDPRRVAVLAAAILEHARAARARPAIAASPPATSPPPLCASSTALAS